MRDGHALELVYGTITSRLGLEGALLFLPRPQAIWLVQVWKSVRGSRTWRQFQQECPPADAQEISSQFALLNGRRPQPEEPLDLTFWIEGQYWPPPRRSLMVQELPPEILRRHGRSQRTVSRRREFEIPLEAETAIVADLTAFGYRCQRDQPLIDATWSGHWSD